MAESEVPHDVVGDPLELSAANREQTDGFSQYTELPTPFTDNGPVFISNQFSPDCP